MAVEIYEVFDGTKDFSFKNQICRATVSVSNNIAEGFDRSSDADFARILYISLGSNSETKSMLYLAARLKYINNDQKIKLIAQSDKISRIIRGLIKSLSPK
ncbi:MAG: hypothetical protein JWQ38_2569 [Flavipsychrobacter sp.]|nr:hypothetical protein [Flavipsychrobacter sp.]